MSQQPAASKGQVKGGGLLCKNGLCKSEVTRGQEMKLLGSYLPPGTRVRDCQPNQEFPATLGDRARIGSLVGGVVGGLAEVQKQCQDHSGRQEKSSRITSSPSSDSS